ncbi:hypothetical protein GGI21_006392, partial [Coemansia aciculifera]
PFVKRIKTWAARHPERRGRPAIIVNRVNAVADTRDAASGPVPLVGSGPLSMQELFKTVSSTKSPVGGSSANAPNEQHSNGESTTSLLQTLMLGNGSNKSTAAAAAAEDANSDSKFVALSNLMRQAGIASTSISGAASTTPPPPPGMTPQVNAGTRHQPPSSSSLRGFAFDTRAIMAAYSGNSG